MHTCPVNKPLAIILVSLSILLATTFLIPPQNKICCMFSANRYLGWPAHYLVLNKTTDDYLEAKKVFQLSTPELLRQGWKLKLGQEMVSPSPSPKLSFLLDVLLSFALGFFCVNSYFRLKKYASI